MGTNEHIIQPGSGTLVPIELLLQLKSVKKSQGWLSSYFSGSLYFNICNAYIDKQRRYAILNSFGTFDKKGREEETCSGQTD